MDHFPQVNRASETAGTRRGFFQQVSTGLYGAALTYLLGSDLRAEGPAAGPHLDVNPRPAHFPPKVRSVIHLFMNGGPSQMDLFDPKPALDRHHGEAYSDRLAGELEFVKD